MELLYVWIENYKNIKKQGFNFSPKHWFDFKYEEDKAGKVTSGTLKHEERNPNYPKDFFGDNISNVTAIVGKNGGGKTNILEFIMETIFNRQNGEKENYIICYYNKIKELCYFITCDFKVDFTAQNIDPLNDERNRYWRYYSANLQKRSTISSLNKIVGSNVDNNTLSLSMYSQLESINIDLENKKTIRFSDLFIKFQFENTQRQIEFLHKHKNALSNLKSSFYIPEKLEIRFPLINNELEIRFKPWLKQGRNTKQVIEDRVKLNILLILQEESMFKIDKSDQLQLIIGDNPDYFTSILNNYLKTLTIPHNSEISQQKWQKSIDDTIIWINRAKQAILKLPKLIDFILGYREAEIDSSNESFIQKSSLLSITRSKIDVINLYNKIDETIGSEFIRLEFSWEGLSAGEEVILNQMGMLNDAYKNIEDNSYIMLAIDEGEVTLHPEWQREYCNLILQTIKMISKPNQKTHLIFSTHSPFLVSDLPKENIIFLNKNDKGNCRVEPLEDMTHTFGANIHSLYRNSFFLENGLMGEFAKGKIDKVIKDLKLKKDDIPEERQKEMKFIIEQIGEPLLKRKLLQMYDEIFHSPEQIDNRIKALEVEIEKLKGRKS